MNELLPPINYTLEEINTAARQLLTAAGDARVFAFSGHLGAGKTTFISALCRALGVSDAVSSPTFALINEYRFNTEGKDKVIYHMDWYRLRDAEEATNAGMEDCLLRQDALCFVEWPEQAPELLNMPHLFITIEPTGGNTRRLKAEKR